jgi:hypothetical protein
VFEIGDTLSDPDKGLTRTQAVIADQSFMMGIVSLV